MDMSRGTCRPALRAANEAPIAVVSLRANTAAGLAGSRTNFPNANFGYITGASGGRFFHLMCQGFLRDGPSFISSSIADSGQLRSTSTAFCC
jgi:hypothetical protein